MDIILQELAQELGLKYYQCENAAKLIDEGNTIPFIARYRKEATGGMDDQTLRLFYEKLTYLRNIKERKEEVIRLIDEQGKLTEEIKSAVLAAKTLTEIDDIYRPFRPKRRTKATIAKEKGLEELAQKILEQDGADIFEFAKKFVDPEKGVNTVDEALEGARDIIAEIISDNAEFRKYIREFTYEKGIIYSSGDEKKDSVYTMYYDFQEPVKKIANHRILAINRGEKEEFLSVKIEVDKDLIIRYLLSKIVTNEKSPSKSIIEEAADDAYKRLIAPSIEREIRNILTQRAQEDAIGLFKINLKNLLMQPPIKDMTVMGIDPGYRTGCKIAVVDKCGKVLDTGIGYFTLPNHDREKAKEIITSLIKKHNVDLIAIGNGTASKESEIFIADLIKEVDRKVYYIIVNEAGASVYSASKLGALEFPDFDVALRSAVSIARRAQDPLAELVKIDPKSIGVGQYQHDLNQKRLSEALEGVVEDCVNTVGVELNTASSSLLSYVAGINQTVAQNIVAYREEHGEFKSRKELLKVPKLGEKAFLQCAGFLRISGAKEILDQTSVHPESYEAAKEILSLCGYTLEDVAKGNIKDINERIKNVDLNEVYQKHGIGEPTVRDIIEALLKPGRDVRDELPKPILRSDLLSIENLKEGMILKGTVRNVIDFGAFVDIGVHQDGLVHISQISEKYIKHPTEVLSVGDIVDVKVLSVDVKRNRISLTMKI